LKGLSALDNFRQSLLVFYLKELSLADEKEEFLKFYTPEIENYLQRSLSSSDSNKEDILQILSYGNSLNDSLKVA
jgi:hypothetical protein